MVQVILVVVCLRDRVVNGRIRKGKPPDDVRPGFPERIKIHCGEDHRRVLPGRFRFRIIVLRRFGLLRQLYMGSNVLIGPGALGILVKVAYHQKLAAKCQQPAEGNHRNTNNFSLWGISAVLALFEIDCGKQSAANHRQCQKPAIQENEIVIPSLRYRFIRIRWCGRIGRCFRIIRVIRGGRFLRLFIEELDRCGFVCLDLHGGSVRNDIVPACPVGDFRYGINANTQPFDLDHAGFWTGKGLTVGAVCALGLKSEPILAPVTGILCNLQVPAVRLIGKAPSGLTIFHNRNLAVLCDGKVVGVLVKLVALRCLAFLHKVALCQKALRGVVACIRFFQCADLRIFGIKFLIAVGVLIQIEYRAVEETQEGVVIFVLFLHRRRLVYCLGFHHLHAAADQGIFHFDFNALAVHTDIDMVLLRAYRIKCRRGNFLYNPVAVRDILKGKAAILGSGDSKQRIFLGKFFRVRPE